MKYLPTQNPKSVKPHQKLSLFLSLSQNLTQNLRADPTTLSSSRQRRRRWASNHRCRWASSHHRRWAASHRRCRYLGCHDCGGCAWVHCWYIFTLLHTYIYIISICNIFCRDMYILDCGLFLNWLGQLYARD